MPVYIHHIETSLPPYSYSQDEVCERMTRLVAEDELQQRIIRSIYSRSGIGKRHSVMSSNDSPTAFQKLFEEGTEIPGTAFRNKIYESEARKLFTQTARKLIDNSPFDKGSITHLITVSCTGFYAPGPDYDIVKTLKLDGSVQRFHLGFMGCYAGLTALKLADQLCQSDPDSVVMVVATELCTIHFQRNAQTDNLISTSVFADGSSGALLSGKHPSEITGQSGQTRDENKALKENWSSDNPAKKQAGNPFLEVTGFVSDITEEGEEDMAWTIGDSGFQMVLSTYIPDILSKNMDGFLQPVFEQFGLSQKEIAHWAIHPGGRAILDKVEKQLNLADNALEHSRAVLRNYGNMSSATILFVLKDLLDSHTGENGSDNVSAKSANSITFSRDSNQTSANSAGDPGQRSTHSDPGIQSHHLNSSVLALAFGPGLTIESGLFSLHRD